MRLIDADALEELFREIIGKLTKEPTLTKDMEHLIRASAMVIEMIADAPTVGAESIVWHEITERPLTPEEKVQYAEVGYANYEIPEYILSCEMPEDGQEILVATSWGVSQDRCIVECDWFDNCIYGLETRGGWDGVKAWTEMPAYKNEKER